MKELGLEVAGYSVVVNGGPRQDVKQLHFHLLAGSELARSNVMVDDFPKNHCFQCGNQLQPRTVDGRIRFMCSKCGWIHYQHLRVGAAAAVENDGRLLLVRRAAEPFKDRWCLPSGYSEADEDPMVTAKRELREETGLDVGEGKLAGVFYFDDDPRGNGILIVYRFSTEVQQVNLDHENKEAGWFRADEFPNSLAGGGHIKAIAFIARQLQNSV